MVRFVLPRRRTSLARHVPDELQTAYYRMLAHTRTLSPDDEMLRIIEAMDILASSRAIPRSTLPKNANVFSKIWYIRDSHSTPSHVYCDGDAAAEIDPRSNGAAGLP
jgi:hypothetical protein